MSDIGEVEHRSLQDAMEHCQNHKVATVFVGETTPAGSYSGYRNVTSLLMGEEASVTIRLRGSGAAIVRYRTDTAKARYKLAQVSFWSGRGS
mgnify:CR=1 FL=1